jgi:two-component system chemotaxis response regulator CheB
MHCRDIVVIGTSAGGVRALQAVVRHLPSDLQAALFVVMHSAPTHQNLLPQILNSAGPLRALVPEDGDMIEKGKIYVAPNNRHLTIEDGRVRIVFGPRENLFRPAIDPLFRSAALHGNRVIGILLSGGLDDGCNGLNTIIDHGGIAVVQDPDDADFPDLPLNAIRRVKVNRILPAPEIAEFLTKEVAKPVGLEENIQ